MRSTTGRGHAKILAALLALSLAAAASCSTARRCAYAGFGRDGWQQPERVIASLEIAPGHRIADLGAGGGYFTFRLADATGAAGEVYAVDVDPGMIEYLEKRAREDAYPNVQVVLGEYEDPLLPEASADLIFTCNTYHHIEDRVAYFRNAQKYLRRDGRVAIIDYKKSGFLGLFTGHATPADVMRSEMEQAGYRLEAEHDYLSRQSFLVFALPAE